MKSPTIIQPPPAIRLHTVDAVMDFVRSQAELRALKQAGLSRDEDLFASPVDSAFNRWPWLAITS